MAEALSTTWCSTKTPCWVNAGTSHRNGSQVYHEHSKPNWKRDVGVSGASLGIGGGEDGVDKDEGTDDFGTQSSAFVVAVLHEVGPTAVLVVVGLLEALGESCATDSAGTLAVDEDEDHATEGPGDAENSDAITLSAFLVGVDLAVVSDDGQDSDVEEKKSGYELRDHRSVQRPLGELIQVDQRRRGRVLVILRRRHRLRRFLNLDVFPH
ncbi:putative aquaporin [Senna tora]|uniref:Putative aquaporin n=1 Tax=Senna tora TaxID=362788 RepID=A0A834TM36_9FABA|nr:putative aquaporin [Senna tora]